MDFELSEEISPSFENFLRNFFRESCGGRLDLSIHREKKIIGAPSFLSLGKNFKSEEIQNFLKKFLHLPGTFRGKNPWKVEEGDHKFTTRKKFRSPDAWCENGTTSATTQPHVL